MLEHTESLIQLYHWENYKLHREQRSYRKSRTTQKVEIYEHSKEDCYLRNQSVK